jgi:hypothetical protein
MAESCAERGVNRNAQFIGVTRRNGDTLDFAVLETDEKGAIRATIRDAREAGNIIPRCVLKAEVV